MRKTIFRILWEIWRLSGYHIFPDAATRAIFWISGNHHGAIGTQGLAQTEGDGPTALPSTGDIVLKTGISAGTEKYV